MPTPTDPTEVALRETVDQYLDWRTRLAADERAIEEEEGILSAIEEALFERIEVFGGSEIGSDPVLGVALEGIANRLCDEALLEFDYERDDSLAITDGDRVSYARRLLAGIVGGDLADADETPTHLLIPVTVSTGQEILLGASVTGYSFTRIQWEFTGIFSSVTARDQELRACGLLLTSDDVASLSDQDILARWQRPEPARLPRPPRVRRPVPATRRDGVNADRYGVLWAWTPQMPGVKHVHAILERLQEVHQWTVIGLAVTGLGVREYLALGRDAIVERFRVFERSDWDEPSRNVLVTLTTFDFADGVVRGAGLPVVWIPPTMTPYLYASIPARTTYGDLMRAWRRAAAEIGAADARLSHLKQLRRYCVGHRQTAPSICALADRLHGWKLSYDEARRMSLRVVA